MMTFDYLTSCGGPLFLMCMTLTKTVYYFLQHCEIQHYSVTGKKELPAAV